MFFLILLLNAFCNGFDVTANSPNFFCQSIELLEKFEKRLQLPVNEAGIERLSSLNYDMQRMMEALNARCLATQSEIQMCKCHIVLQLLDPNTYTPYQLAIKTFPYFNKIQWKLVDDWISLESSDKEMICAEKYDRFQSYQNLFAQKINTKENKEYLKNLQKFAINFEIIKTAALNTKATCEQE